MPHTDNTSFLRKDIYETIAPTIVFWRTFGRASRYADNWPFCCGKHPDCILTCFLYVFYNVNLSPHHLPACQKEILAFTTFGEFQKKGVSTALEKRSYTEGRLQLVYNSINHKHLCLPKGCIWEKKTPVWDKKEIVLSLISVIF